MDSWLTGIENTAMQYGVSAPLLVGLYGASIPFFYFGLWLCIADVRTNGLHGSFKRQKFIFGLVILAGAWVLPYAYVLLSSRGFPWFGWLVLLTLLFFTAYSTWRTLSKNASKDVLENGADS